MKNIYVCGCFQEEFQNKTFEEVIQFFTESVDNSIIRINLDEDYYFCCRMIIDFCYKANRCYFLEKTCSTCLYGTFVSCVHLIKFGFNTICCVCVIPLQKKLFPFLIKIK